MCKWFSLDGKGLSGTLMVCLMAFAPLEISAQKQVTDTITGKVHVIDEVTVSTTARSRNVTSTAPTLLVTQRQLLSQGVTDLSDALRRFSGVNVRDYGGAGGV